MITDEQLEKLEDMSKIKLTEDKKQKMKQKIDEFISMIKIFEEWKVRKN